MTVDMRREMHFFWRTYSNWIYRCMNSSLLYIYEGEIISWMHKFVDFTSQQSLQQIANTSIWSIPDWKTHDSFRFGVSNLFSPRTNDKCPIMTLQVVINSSVPAAPGVPGASLARFATVPAVVQDHKAWFRKACALEGSPNSAVSWTRRWIGWVGPQSPMEHGEEHGAELGPWKWDV